MKSIQSLRKTTLYVFICLAFLEGGGIYLQSIKAQARFQNASYFMGDDAEDKLLPPNEKIIQSSELLLYRSDNQLHQASKHDYYKVLDFLGVPGDPDTSLLYRNGYNFQEIDSAGTGMMNLPETPAMVPVVGDFDGDGFDEIIRAIEDDNGEILFYSQPEVMVNWAGDSLYSSSTEIYRIEAPASGYLSMPASSSRIKLTSANFGETAKDHLIISYLRRLSDSTFSLNLELWQDGETVKYDWEIPFGSAYSVMQEVPKFDLVSVDLDLDRIPELAVVYHQVISQSGTTFDTEVIIPVLKYENGELQEETRITKPSSIGLSQTPNQWTREDLYLATGDLNGDLAQELFLKKNTSSWKLGDWFRNEYEFWIYQACDDGDREGINVLDTLIEVGYDMGLDGPQNYPPSNIRYKSDIEIGDIDGDSKDEIIVASISYSITNSQPFIEAYPEWTFRTYNVSDSFHIHPSSQTIKNDIWYGNPNRIGAIPFPQQFLQIADLNGDGESEICTYEINYFSGKHEVLVYRFDGPSAGSSYSGNLSLIGRKSPVFENPGSNYLTTFLLAGDFDGDGLRLGKPKYFQKTSIQRPLVILNAPPIHFDRLNGVSYDINGCYNGQTCDFYSRYEETITNSFTAETEFNSGWTTSKEVGAGISAKILKITAKIGSTYGEKFSNYNGVGSKVTISSAIEATVEDRLYAAVVDYGIYEYPIYSKDSLIGHIMTMTPHVTQNRWFSTESWFAYDYFPRHEVGSLLSYEGFLNTQQNTDVFLDPTLEELVKVQGDGFEVDASSNYQWQVDFSTFSSNSQSWSSFTNVKKEAQANIGGKLLGIGVELGAKISGQNYQSGISTHTTNISQNLDLKVKLGSTSLGLESDYTVSPYLYWAKNGALVVDYSVLPEVERPGGTPTWWSANYGLEQDPALILPWRLHEEKGFILQDPEKKYQSRSITYIPADAKSGDTITVYVAIHNYSLLPTNTEVGVGFYLGHPNHGGTRLVSIDGEDEVFTLGPIEARARKLVAFKWKIPTSVSAFPRIYAYIDPSGIMTEIHEDNNIGWTILDTDGLISSTEEEFDFDNQASTESFSNSFPNPFSQSCMIRFTLDKSSSVQLRILDIVGKQISVLENTHLPPGEHERRFDANGLTPGIYLYQLQVGDKVESKRMILMN